MKTGLLCRFEHEWGVTVTRQSVQLLIRESRSVQEHDNDTSRQHIYVAVTANFITLIISIMHLPEIHFLIFFSGGEQNIQYDIIKNTVNKLIRIDWDIATQYGQCQRHRLATTTSMHMSDRKMMSKPNRLFTQIAGGEQWPRWWSQYRIAHCLTEHNIASIHWKRIASWAVDHVLQRSATTNTLHSPTNIHSQAPTRNLTFQ